jgi:Tol biopolymer transport system component
MQEPAVDPGPDIDHQVFINKPFLYQYDSARLVLFNASMHRIRFLERRIMQQRYLYPRKAAALVIALAVSLAPAATSLAASWSPDGELLAFSYIGGPENIYIVGTDGGDVRPIVVRDQRDFRPEWSPDGSHLVFTTVIDGVHAIVRVDVDGKNLRQVTPTEEAAGDPDYSPDGRRLIYFTDEPLPRDLFVLDVASGKVTRLTDTADFEEMSPRWHPDGRQAVFVGKETGEDVESDIWALDTGSGARQNLTGTASVGEFHPDWSHDGTRVVYIRVENGNFDVAIRDVASGAETIVASGNGFAVLDPHFSPNDTEVTFTRTDFAEEGEGMPAIVAVSLEDGTERTIARGLYLSQMGD